MTVEQFVGACGNGDAILAKLLYDQDPGLLNRRSRDYDNDTGLLASLRNLDCSLSRWILSPPKLDTTMCSICGNMTALHMASEWVSLPLDILITLTKLSSWETINMEAQQLSISQSVLTIPKPSSTSLGWGRSATRCRKEN